MVGACINKKSVYLINTSTHSVRWPLFAEMICKRFKYDQVSPMVTGAEGADLACKIARRYAHEVKGVPTEKVLVLGVSGSYHGLTAGVWNLQDPSPARTGKTRREDSLLLSNRLLQRTVSTVHNRRT
jgi:ornithine--oxo-acid transaminase